MKLCPNHNLPLELKSNSSGGKFWGCPKFRDAGCRHTQPYENPTKYLAVEAGIKIMEIDNGWILSTTDEDGSPTAQLYAKDEGDLKKQLAASLKQLQDKIYLIATKRKSGLDEDL